MILELISRLLEVYNSSIFLELLALDTTIITIIISLIILILIYNYYD